VEGVVAAVRGAVEGGGIGGQEGPLGWKRPFECNARAVCVPAFEIKPRWVGSWQ
jgi:hypothetical protein